MKERATNKYFNYFKSSLFTHLISKTPNKMKKISKAGIAEHFPKVI